MKILFITPHLSTGGAPQYLLKKITELIDSCDVYCVEYSNITGGVLVVQRSQIENILKNKLITLSDNKYELTDYINSINPDIIHFEEMPEYFCDKNLAKQIYSKERKYKIIETSHDSSFNPKDKCFFPDQFVFVSKYQQQIFSELNIPSDVVEYPIVYKEKTNRDKSLIDLGLDPTKTHVLNVGLFTPRKNQLEILNYAKELLNENVQFHFVGNQADNFRWYWEPLMKNFPKNCKWWGERKDVDTFYNAMDVFLFSSKGTDKDKETNPLVVREAIGWNIPTLMYKLPVYMDMYDQYKCINWMYNEKEKNINLLKSFIKNKTPITTNDDFNISIEDSENKIHITYNGENTLNNVLISVKDRDSKACIYSYQENVMYKGFSFWLMPLPKGFYDFEKNLNFGGFLIQIYENNNLFFEKDFKYRDISIKKPIVDFSDVDPIFLNYNEFFVEQIYKECELVDLDLCIDMGSNVGLFTKFLLNNDAKKIFCFEPNKKAYARLCKNMANENGVYIFNSAISTSSNPIKLYIDDNNSLISSIASVAQSKWIHKHETNEYYEVNAITMDQIIKNNDIQKISFLKIDIEGFEFELIENWGVYEFSKIERMLIEHHKFYFDDGEQRLLKLKTKLNEYGYRLTYNHNFIYASKFLCDSTLETIQTKLNFGTDKNSTHCYLSTYDKLFFPYKNKNIDLLEIGIYSGESLKLWNKYFTNKSNIYGIDIDLSHLSGDVLNKENITVINKNINHLSTKLFSDMLFDIVIDDGSHSKEDQIYFYEFFKNKLKPGGILIIEDIADYNFDIIKQYVKDDPNVEFFDYRNIKNRFDDIILIYRKTQ
jgi:FkbM family methyltransferase